MKKEVKHNIHIAIIATVLILAMYYTINPAYTGFTVLGNNGFEISNLSLFDYNSEEIEISNGIISLKGTETTYEWLTYSQEIFPLTGAFSEPLDKLSKVSYLDSDSLDIENDEIANAVFSNSINNGDILTLYLKNEETTNVYACLANEECSSSSNKGYVYFPNSEGYYNVTLENLDYATKVININSDENLKIDHITSSQGNLSGFWYEPSNRTNTLTALDGDSFTADKDEILDVRFDEYIQDEDVLQIYFETKEATEIFACDASTECVSPGYGLLNYNGSLGWFNISLSLETPIKSLNIRSAAEDIKPNFINLLRITEQENSETNITYPSTANITTQNLEISRLEKWDLLSIEENLNSQNISYEYSTDSGTTWNIVPEDKNLSIADTESNNIKIKAVLSGNESSTPSLSSINITYFTADPETYYELNETELVSAIENREFRVNASSLKTELNINPSESFSNVLINITAPNENKPSNLPRVKELEINAPGLNNKIDSAALKVYYTSSEISGINEDSLKLYYYNETSQTWEALPSIVNKIEKYVEANLEHFSTYGLFGEQQSSSNNDNIGSGGKSSFTRPAVSPQPEQVQEESQQPEASSEQEETQQPIEEISPVGEVSEFSLTGSAVNITQVLTEGKLNISLLILLGILIGSYIFFRIKGK